MKIDRYQGDNGNGEKFGYVYVGEGGLFFTWRYDQDAKAREKIKQICSTIEVDEIDPPTGRWSLAGVERALRSHIARRGIL
jgi:hypothetical protein